MLASIACLKATAVPYVLAASETTKTEKKNHYSSESNIKLIQTDT